MQKSAVSYSYHVKQGTDQVYGPVVLGQVAPNRNSTLASTCIPLTREKNRYARGNPSTGVNLGVWKKNWTVQNLNSRAVYRASEQNQNFLCWLTRTRFTMFWTDLQWKFHGITGGIQALPCYVVVFHSHKPQFHTPFTSSHRNCHCSLCSDWSFKTNESKRSWSGAASEEGGFVKGIWFYQLSW